MNTVLRLKPQFIILDARERTQSFVELCRCMRSVADTSTVQLVALVRPGTTDCLDLLEAGADDCWAGPIEAREFRIRLSAFYQRLHRPTSSRVLRRGDVELDLDRYTVRSSGPPAQLTAMQLKLLKHLMEHAGVFVSQMDLLKKVWCDAELSPEVVRTCIKRLRQVLTATGAVNVIRSAKGAYSFDTEVTPIRVPWRSEDPANAARSN